MVTDMGESVTARWADQKKEAHKILNPTSVTIMHLIQLLYKSYIKN